GIRDATVTGVQTCALPIFPKEQRRLASRLGALAQQARHDPREYTQAAREAFRLRFERQVDPECVLDPAERARRAEAALRAHMLQIGRASCRESGENERGRG